MSTASSLSIRRLVTYQQYTAPLIIVSETAQQTALPFLEAMVRESLARNMRIVAVCIDGLPSSDIANSPKTGIVDQRLSLDSILATNKPSSAATDMGIGAIDQNGFSQLQSAIDRGLQNIQTQMKLKSGNGSDDGVLVVIDSLDRLLRSSQTSTLMLVRRVRQAVCSVPKSRVVARFSRDLWDSKSWSYAANALCELADATVDVHPLDDLRTWMPGWYSDGRARPFMSLRNNDFRRGLARLEHKRQSGKISFEVSSFEIDAHSQLLKFSAVDVSAEPRLPQAQTNPSMTQAKGTSTEQKSQKAQPTQPTQTAQTAPAQQKDADPAADLSFNLSLTDKQRQDRANVELPYLNAQVMSAGEIHYQMDDEDDWDSDDPDDDLEI